MNVCERGVGCQRAERDAAKPLQLRLWDPVLNKGAIWTYWEGAYRDTGRDEGATLVLQTVDKQGWFWYIPLHNNVVSVGVVAPFDYLFQRARQHEKTVREEVERNPAVKRRVSMGRRVTGYFVTKDYSYRSKQTAGDGWVLVGDAFGFLDPLYSSGVLLALSPDSWPRRPLPRVWRKAIRPEHSWANGDPSSTTASTACGAWSASTTQGSVSESSFALSDLRGTITIFSLATSSQTVSTKCGNRGVLYRQEITDRFMAGGHAGGSAAGKANALILPTVDDRKKGATLSKYLSTLFMTFVVFSGVIANVRAENWPQWRGPSLNGVSAEANLPVRWSATENIAWKLALPSWSGSTPIVWGTTFS